MATTERVFLPINVNYPLQTESYYPEEEEQERSIQERQRKLEEAKKHILHLENQVTDLQVLVRRLSRRGKGLKLQYGLKHRIAVFSGIRVMYQKYCLNLQEEMNELQNFQ